MRVRVMGARGQSWGDTGDSGVFRSVETEALGRKDRELAKCLNVLLLKWP